MPKSMSRSQQKRAERDQKRRERGELTVQAEKKSVLIYQSGAIGVGPVEEPIPFDSTAEVYAWVNRLAKANGITVRKDVRLHTKR